MAHQHILSCIESGHFIITLLSTEAEKGQFLLVGSLVGRSTVISLGHVRTISYPSHTSLASLLAAVYH